MVTRRRCVTRCDLARLWLCLVRARCGETLLDCARGELGDDDEGCKLKFRDEGEAGDRDETRTGEIECVRVGEGESCARVRDEVMEALTGVWNAVVLALVGDEDFAREDET